MSGTHATAVEEARDILFMQNETTWKDQYQKCVLFFKPYQPVR